MLLKSKYLKYLLPVTAIFLLSCGGDKNKVESPDKPELVSGPADWTVFRGNRELNGSVDARLSSSPELLWSFQAGDGFIGTPVSDGVSLFAADISGTVYSLDIRSGGENWRYSVENDSFEASPLLEQGRIYIPTLGGLVLALDMNDGTLLWQTDLESRIISTPVAIPDGPLYVGSYNSYLYSLSREEGSLLWEYKTGSYINGSVAMRDRRLYFGGCDGVLRCTDADGTELFTYRRDSYMPGSPAIRDGEIYSAHYDGSITILDIWSGELIRTVYPHDEETFTSSPSVDDQTIYLGGKSGRFYGIARDSGELQWTFQSGGAIESGALVTDDQVWFGSADHLIYCLDKTNGEILFSYDGGSPITGGIIAVDGSVIALTDSGLVLTLGVP